MRAGGGEPGWGRAGRIAGRKWGVGRELTTIRLTNCPQPLDGGEGERLVSRPADFAADNLTNASRSRAARRVSSQLFDK
jgi:hypothetical protein